MEHFIVSVIIGSLIFLALYWLKKKEKINLPSYMLILVYISSIVFLFLLLAYLFPVRVWY